MSLLSRFRKVPPPPAPSRLAEASVAPAATPVASETAKLAAQEEQALRSAIADGDFTTIGRLVIEGTSTKIRQIAAEAVVDAVQIRQLIKEVRGGNDKSVYKILARKRDALLAQEREVEQLHAEIGAVAAAIERHSRRPYDALFTPTLDQLEHRWQVVAARAELRAERGGLTLQQARAVVMVAQPCEAVVGHGTVQVGQIVLPHNGLTIDSPVR